MITPLDPALRIAWLELLAIALLVAPVGVWALHRRALFAAEVLPHAMLPTAGLAAVLGASVGVGGVIGAMLGAGAVSLLGRGTAERDLDSAATTVLGAATGLGAILTIQAAGTRGLERLLFGDPLSATSGSVTLALGGAVLIGAGALVGHRALLATTLGDDTPALPACAARPSSCSRRSRWRWPSRCPLRRSAPSSRSPCWWARLRSARLAASASRLRSSRVPSPACSSSRLV